VYAGGSFFGAGSIGGQARNNIAALDAGTGLATAWNPNANNAAGCFALDGTNLYVGGSWSAGAGFTTIGGSPRAHFAAFGPPPSAAYTGTVFTEAAANNGSITVTQDVTLTGDTWVPAGAFTGGGTHFTATGVPGGLTLAINRISATVARLSFTGNAAAHANAQDATFTLAFANAAVASNNAAAVTGLNLGAGGLSLDFNDNPPTAFSAATPPTGTNGIAYTYTFVANGTPAPTYTLQSGTLPTGLTLNAATGVLSGTPTAGGSFGPFVIRATNVAGTFDTPGITVTVNAAPTAFSAAAPPAGTNGIAYTYTFVANGSPTPTYTLQSGTLPPGLTLSGAGVLSGTPTALGTFGPFVVRATNVAGTFDTPGLNITIGAAPIAPTAFSAATPPTGTEGTAYTSTFVANGSPVPTYSLFSGTLPVGLTLSAAGVLSGTPTAAGTFGPFVIRATNVAGSFNTPGVNITINAAFVPPVPPPPPPPVAPVLGLGGGSQGWNHFHRQRQRWCSVQHSHNGFW
jgi:hypothetical protein